MYIYFAWHRLAEHFLTNDFGPFYKIFLFVVWIKSVFESKFMVLNWRKATKLAATRRSTFPKTRSFCRASLECSAKWNICQKLISIKRFRPKNYRRKTSSAKWIKRVSTKYRPIIFTCKLHLVPIYLVNISRTVIYMHTITHTQTVQIWTYF